MMAWDGLVDDIRNYSSVLRRLPSTKITSDRLDTLGGAFRAGWAKSRLIEGTEIPIPAPRNQALHPTGCSAETASLSFSFSPPMNEQVPLPERAEFQIRVAGTLQADNVYFELEDHWRVDTHRFDDEKSPGREPHPIFHFQRGGHAQTSWSQDAAFLPGRPKVLQGPVWKGLLQTPGPRMPSLPFDPILAIDFCIGQCDGITLRRLRAEPEYGNLVRKAQERLWRPFFEALAQPEFQSKWLGAGFLA